jgi:hypothetical protein
MGQVQVILAQPIGDPLWHTKNARTVDVRKGVLAKIAEICATMSLFRNYWGAMTPNCLSNPII